MAASVLIRPPTREMPVGMVWVEMDDLVGDDRDDVRVGEQVALLLLVELGREAAERAAERSVGLDAVALADLRDDRGRVRAVLEHDDEAAGGVGGAGRRPGPARLAAGAGSRARARWTARPWARRSAARLGVALGRARFGGRRLGVGSGSVRGSRPGPRSARSRGRRGVGRARRGDDREGDEHGEEQGRDPSVHSGNLRPMPRLRLRPLGPIRCSHGVRGTDSPIRPACGAPLRPRSPGSGCSSASCRDRSRPPSSRSRSTSAGP